MLAVARPLVNRYNAEPALPIALSAQLAG